MSNVPEPNLYPWIGVSDLRVGMFIHLNLSWLEHPFPLGSFRIATPAQIETLRGLGLQQVRYDPVKSSLDNPHGGLELVPAVAPPPLEPLPAGGAATQAATPSVPVAPLHEQQWQEQERKLAVCDQQFSQASLQYQKVAGAVETDPASARAVGQALVSDCVSGLLNNGESAIRLLSEGLGGRNALHSVNVMVISLLLGRALGMAEAQLQDLGLAALLHDLGMVRLPVHLRQSSSKWTIADKALYRSHVDESVVLAQRMGLSEAVLTAIAQHHEMADGSGFPLHLFGDNFSQAGRILALVNHYDRMCNPSSGVTPLTPHEALSVIFAQLKPRFDPVTLGAFIRMMGVYPPGSIVELLNERYAIVVSVNSARPLRPKVIVHDPAVPKEQALIVDLEAVPGLGIRRSIKPSQLAQDALEYLSPRQRICYFFEKVDGAGDHSAT